MTRKVIRIVAVIEYANWRRMIWRMSLRGDHQCRGSGAVFAMSSSKENSLLNLWWPSFCISKSTDHSQKIVHETLFHSRPPHVDIKCPYRRVRDERTTSLLLGLGANTTKHSTSTTNSKIPWNSPQPSINKHSTTTITKCTLPTTQVYGDWWPATWSSERRPE